MLMGKVQSVKTMENVFLVTTRKKNGLTLNKIYIILKIL